MQDTYNWRTLGKGKHSDEHRKVLINFNSFAQYIVFLTVHCPQSDRQDLLKVLKGDFISVPHTRY